MSFDTSLKEGGRNEKKFTLFLMLKYIFMPYNNNLNKSNLSEIISTVVVISLLYFEDQ